MRSSAPHALTELRELDDMVRTGCQNAAIALIVAIIATAIIANKKKSSLICS